MVLQLAFYKFYKKKKKRFLEYLNSVSIKEGKLQAVGEGSDVRSDGSAATPEDRRAKLRVHSGAAPGGSTRSTALRVLSLKQFRYLIRQALDLTGGVHS